VKNADKPVIMEGKIWRPEEVSRAFQLGAYAVVVGSAITRPQLITRRFVQAVPKS
jgi:N-acylglucosamine-6-phosphate 2-epimerase